MADEGSVQSTGISLFVEASGATTGAAEFSRSAEQVKKSAKEAEEGVLSLKEELNELFSESLAESLESVSSGLESLNKGFEAIGVGAVAASFAELVEHSSELEDAFIHLEAATGLIGSKMEELKETTRGLSDSLGVDQADVIKVQLEAAGRGFSDVAQQAQVTQAALQFAKAAFIDNATAGDLLTKTLQSFKLSGDQAVNVAESLTVALVKGGIPAAQLNQEFIRLGPTIRDAGLSINEFIKTLLSASAAGIEGRVALSGVQELFRAIAGDNASSVAAFNALIPSLRAVGVEANSFKELVGEKGLSGALQLVRDRSNGTKETLAALVGGEQALVSANGLLNLSAEQVASITEQMTKKHESFEKTLEDVTGSAKTQGEILKANLSNVLDDLGSNILPLVNKGLELLLTNTSKLGAGNSKDQISGIKQLFSGVTEITGGIKGSLVEVTNEILRFNSAFQVFRGFLRLGQESQDLVNRLVPPELLEKLGLLNDKVKEINENKPTVDLTNGPIKTSADRAREAEAEDKARATASLVKTTAELTAANTKARDIEAELSILRHASNDDLIRLGFTTKGEVAEAVSLLTSDLIKNAEAQDKYNLAFQQAASKNDPVAAQVVAYAAEIRKLGDAYKEAGSRAQDFAKYQLALRQADVANQVKNTDIAFKIQEQAAPTPEIKTFLSTVSTQSQNLIQLQELQREGKISRDALTAAFEASGLAIDKASLATAGLTAQQLNLAKAQIAFRESKATIENSGGSVEQQNRALAEANVIYEDAARKADTYGLRVTTLAGQFVPLIATTQKFSDQLKELNSLAAIPGLKPEQYTQIQQAQTILPIQQKQEQDKSLILPAADKASIDAADQYAVTVAKLTAELTTVDSATGKTQISQAQFNQGLAEAQQQAEVAAQKYDLYVKAVIDGGSAIDKSLTGVLESLGNRATTLRSLFEGLAKSLQASASQVLAKSLEQGLVNNVIPAGKFNDLIAQGFGVLPRAKKGGTTPDVAAAEGPPKPTADDLALRPIDNEANFARRIDTPTTPLETSGGGSGLIQAAADLSQSASQLQTAASALQSAGGSGVVGQATAAPNNNLTTPIFNLPSTNGLINNASAVDSKIGAGIAPTELVETPTLNSLNAFANPFTDESKSLNSANTVQSNDLNNPFLGLPSNGVSNSTSSQGSLNSAVKPPELQLTSDDIKALTSSAINSKPNVQLPTSLSLPSLNIPSSSNDPNKSFNQGLEGGALAGIGDLVGGNDKAAESSFAQTALKAAFHYLLPIPGFATGGNVHGGTTAMVGERGPELVTFGSDAHITPNDQVQAAVGAGSRAQTVVSAPNVNVPVQVVNVSDPSEVPNAIAGQAGTKAILNMLSKNKTAVNSILS